MDEFDKVTDEAHDDEAQPDSTANLEELCGCEQESRKFQDESVRGQTSNLSREERGRTFLVRLGASVHEL